MSADKLDIPAWRVSIKASLEVDFITSEDFEGFMQALDELEEARKRIVGLEKKIPQCFILMPKHWPSRYNASHDPCDTIDGPCSCGAWHSIYDKWVQNNMKKYGINP